ncbi:nitroreductase [Comamonas piscis]|uniref:Nitroreductase n=1 Tax=Comamonas piscis TaxID=1562974 RepID=A0A7G5EHH1_9BURK|nr:nitroreductase [Comamonas piscis]QMV73446.1 nitroreductase [Comamonas piscis]WSO31860.1 nitroreductase [Comamonas piscis]
MNKPLSPSLISTVTPAANSAQLRRSVRGFASQPVADALLHDCLQEARRAPSGANLQPGYFWQVCGARREQLSTQLQHAYEAGEQEAEDYGYFPSPLPMSMRKRQVAAAQALYGALGVERGDAAGRGAQFGRNFRFFDAPVALIITIDSGFGPGGYMDLGMAIYGLMLAAQSRGLATCAIGAMASYPGLIRDVLALPSTQTVVCGMALGYEDVGAPVNQALTARAELDAYFKRLD